MTGGLAMVGWTGYDGMNCPDSKVHEANMGPIWGRQGPGGAHVGPMNFATWVAMYGQEMSLTRAHWPILPVIFAHSICGFVLLLICCQALVILTTPPSNPPSPGIVRNCHDNELWGPSRTGRQFDIKNESHFIRIKKSIMELVQSSYCPHW